MYETAVEQGWQADTLARLRVKLDAIEEKRYAKLRKEYEEARTPAKIKRLNHELNRSSRRRSVDETLEAVRTLRAEGLAVSTVADRLGVTDLHVQRCVRVLGKEARKPSIHAAEKHLKPEPGLSVVL